MIVLISGGAKNGKSDFAQALALKLARGGKHYYVATMLPTGEEDQARIRAHRESRAGMGFETVECFRDILSLTERADPDATFLLDSTTSLMMNELFHDTVTWQPDADAAGQCAADLARFVRSVRNVVVVSDGIYSDAKRYGEATELYRRFLAEADRRIAAEADAVVEFSAGFPILFKGSLPL